MRCFGESEGDQTRASSQRTAGETCLPSIATRVVVSQSHESVVSRYQARGQRRIPEKTCRQNVAMFAQISWLFFGQQTRQAYAGSSAAWTQVGREKKRHYPNPKAPNCQPPQRKNVNVYKGNSLAPHRKPALCGAYSIKWSSML